MIPQDLKPLSKAIEESFAIKLSDMTRVSGGLDLSSSAYQITTDRGLPFFVKQRPELTPGMSLSAALNDSGISEVLAPLPPTTGGVALEVDQTVVLLYPFKEGHNGFERPLLPEHWRHLGTTLRKIHESHLPQAITAQLPKEPFRVEGIAEFETLRSSPESDQVPGLQDVLRANEQAIQTILKRTEELALECRRQQWRLVPCHADIHVGNVIAGDSGAITIVDWDAPRLAPRECDLMFFCGGGITGHGAMEESCFFQGYGLYEPNRLLLTYYRYARALEDIVSFTREACDPNPRYPAQTAESVRFLKGQFAKDMIVETAFRSDATL